MADDFVYKLNSQTGKFDKVPRPDLKPKPKVQQPPRNAVEPNKGLQTVHIHQPLTNQEPKKILHDGAAKKVSAYRRGAYASQKKLFELGVDPIEELVRIYVKLKEELVLYEDWRAGKIIPLDEKGNTRRYSSMAHMACFDRLIAIQQELLRYGYGRVPESVDLNIKRPQALVMNLTKKGEQFVVNEQATDVEYTEHDDD